MPRHVRNDVKQRYFVEIRAWKAIKCGFLCVGRSLSFISKCQFGTLKCPELHFECFPCNQYADNDFSVHSYPKVSKNSMASNTVENVLLLVYSHLSLSSVSVNSGKPSCKSSFNTAFAFFTASGYRSAIRAVAG